MTSNLARTPLYDWHAEHGGRMVDFAGWSMPVQYTSIVAEHVATRSAVGLFDVSHMGRLRFDAPGGGRFLNRLLTRRVVDMQPGEVRYATVTNNQGGVLDDVLVYRLLDRQGTPYHALVVNAGNREKIVDWIQSHLTPDDDLRFVDETLETAMIAVQGPKAIELADPLVSVDLAGMNYYQALQADINGAPGLVSRTGYTGEDGCELIVPAAAATELWTTLLDRGASLGATAAGLGARDTLRLEAAMPLYGHELNEQIDPFLAGLKFAVNLEGRTFPGRDALAAKKDEPGRPRRVGLELSGKRPAREGYPVVADGRRIGEVTSGTFSPTLNHPIAMAYVEPEFAAPGTQVAVEIRNRTEPAEVVKLPFYRRS